MLYFYQHLPQYVNPIAFSIGNFSVRWYSVMYLLGFFVVYVLLKYDIQNTIYKIRKDLITDFLLYSFAGLLIGARLGYVLFYNLSYYIQNPLAIISPIKDGNFVGIFGMSYFGGLIGIILVNLIFLRKRGINFWKWSDFVVPAIPAGYFFGRIGNFLNGELYGKATNHWFGMYFPVETQNIASLRHPTQLYEALLEGLLLFLIFWFLRNNTKIPGTLFTLYIAGYGVIRFFIEFLREQEGNLVLGLTRGQILSLGLIVSAGIIYAIIPLSNVFREQK